MVTTGRFEIERNGEIAYLGRSLCMESGTTGIGRWIRVSYSLSLARPRAPTSSSARLQDRRVAVRYAFAN